MIQRISNSNLHDKVLIIGNRLANERNNSMNDPNNEIIKCNGSQLELRPKLAPPAPPPLPAPAVNSNQGLRDDAQMVDFISSFLFPLSFIVFNIIYWMVYLNMQVESNN